MPSQVGMLRALCRNAHRIVNRHYRDDKAKLVVAPSTDWGKLGKINARFPLSVFRPTSTLRPGKRECVTRGVNICFACRAWNLNVHGFAFVTLLDFIGYLLIASFTSVRRFHLVSSSSIRYSRSPPDLVQFLVFLFLIIRMFWFFYIIARIRSRLRPIQRNVRKFIRSAEFRYKSQAHFASNRNNK